MPVTATKTANVDSIVSMIGPDTRASVLHTIIDEFFRDGTGLPPGAAMTIDGLMLRLVEQLGLAAKAGLAERLAHASDGPRRTLRAFALDADASVACPVLRHSALLAERDLVAVARVRGQAHLRALAGRDGLSEAVSDLVVARGEAAILLKLAGNRTARLSARGLDGLARAALADGRLGEALAGRLVAGPSDGGAGKVTILPPALPPALGPATGREEAPRRRRLSDDDVAACIDRGCWSEAVLLIAELAGQPVGIVSDALTSPDPNRSLLVMRLANLGTDVAEKVLRARVGGAGSGRGIADQKAAYVRLSRASAERSMRLILLHSSIMGADAAGQAALRA